MKLALPDVTLIITETRSHALMKRTVDDALRKVDFGHVVICADQFNTLRVPGARHVMVTDWASKLEWEQFIWKATHLYVPTSHAMFMEWDAGIVDPAMWHGGFLAYDYIGAPWWYRDGRNVGNGGLHLRSKNLMHFLAMNADAFPCKEPGDDVLCRQYRPTLEKAGFRWAPESLAHQFSFECAPPSPAGNFGFHAMRNWPKVLGREELLTRTRLALESPYIRGTDMVQQLFAVAPWLKGEIDQARMAQREKVE